MGKQPVGMGGDIRGCEMMPDISLEGQKSNYIYGYLPKEEPLPEGWVRTMRPCPECNSEYTHIDADKVWHCIRCGWRSDTEMRYSDEEVALIVEKKSEGCSNKEIASMLHRDVDTLNQKIFQLRKKGILGRPVDKVDKHDTDEKKPADMVFSEIKQVFKAHAVGKTTRNDDDPLCNALLAAKGIGLSLLSACVDSNTATLVFTLDLAKGGVE